MSDSSRRVADAWLCAAAAANAARLAYEHADALVRENRAFLSIAKAWQHAIIAAEAAAAAAKRAEAAAAASARTEAAWAWLEASAGRTWSSDVVDADTQGEVDNGD